MRLPSIVVIPSFVLLACYLIPTTRGSDARNSSHSKLEWKEYVYSNHGFAITAPQAPKETEVKDGTQYQLYWNNSWDEDTQIVVDLTAFRSPIDCAACLTSSRQTLRNLEVSIKGNPAFESDVSELRRTEYQRLECLNGRVYEFYARWPRQIRPAIVNRIFEGFRVTSPEIKQ